MRAIAISFLKIAAFAAIWLVGLFAVGMAVEQYAGTAAGNVGWQLAAEIGGLIIVLAALIIMALGVDKRSITTIGLGLRAAPGGLVAGLTIGIVIFALPIGILMALGFAEYRPEFSKFDTTLLLWLLAITLINSAHQELLVRSYLFQELWAKYSSEVAVVVSTVVFVALHAEAIMQGVPGLIAAADIALASIMLGLAYVRTGALWLPIGIHFGWNGLQGPILGIAVTGTDSGERWHALAFTGPELWTGGAMGVEGGLAGLAGPLLGIAIVMLLPREPNAFQGVAPMPTPTPTPKPATEPLDDEVDDEVGDLADDLSDDDSRP